MARTFNAKRNPLRQGTELPRYPTTRTPGGLVHFPGARVGLLPGSTHLRTASVFDRPDHSHDARLDSIRELSPRGYDELQLGVMSHRIR